MVDAHIMVTQKTQKILLQMSDFHTDLEFVNSVSLGKMWMKTRKNIILPQHSSSKRFSWVFLPVLHSVDLPGEHRNTSCKYFYRRKYICAWEVNLCVMMTHQDRERSGTIGVPLGWVHLHLPPRPNHLEVKSHTEESRCWHFFCEDLFWHPDKRWFWTFAWYQNTSTRKRL